MGFIILDVIFFVVLTINPSMIIPDNPFTVIVELSWIVQLIFLQKFFNPKAQKEADERIRKKSNELFIQTYEFYGKCIDDVVKQIDFQNFVAQFIIDGSYYKPYGISAQTKAEIIRSAVDSWHRNNPGHKRYWY